MARTPRNPSTDLPPEDALPGDEVDLLPGDDIPDEVAALRARLAALESNRIDPAELDRLVAAQAERLFSAEREKFEARLAAERATAERLQAEALAERQAEALKAAQAREDMVRAAGSTGDRGLTHAARKVGGGVASIPHGTKGKIRLKWSPKEGRTALVSSTRQVAGKPLNRMASGYPLILRWPGALVRLDREKVVEVDKAAFEHYKAHNAAVRAYVESGDLLILST